MLEKEIIVHRFPGNDVNEITNGIISYLAVEKHITYSNYVGNYYVCSSPYD